MGPKWLMVPATPRPRPDRFRQGNILRELFERVVADCIARRLVGGEGFAVDASLIEADANKCRSIPGKEWNKDRNRDTASRAVREYLDTLDDEAFGAASDVTPKFVSRSDPAAQWTGAMKDKAFFAEDESSVVVSCIPCKERDKTVCFSDPGYFPFEKS